MFHVVTLMTRILVDRPVWGTLCSSKRNWRISPKKNFHLREVPTTHPMRHMVDLGRENLWNSKDVRGPHRLSRFDLIRTTGLIFLELINVQSNPTMESRWPSPIFALTAHADSPTVLAWPPRTGEESFWTIFLLISANFGQSCSIFFQHVCYKSWNTKI